MRWFSRQKLMNRLAVLTGRGEHDQVVLLAEDALRDGPDDSTVLIVLANSLERLGQREHAAKARERFLALEPDNKHVLYLLGRYHEDGDRVDEALGYYSRLLNSHEVTYPLTGRDFRFLAFLATLFGGDARKLESQARQTSERLDLEQSERQVHAERYVAANRSKAHA